MRPNVARIVARIIGARTLPAARQLRVIFAVATGAWTTATCADHQVDAPATTGLVAVATVTSGEPIPAPMVVSLDATSRSIGHNAILTFESLTPGSHALRIAGVSEYCEVEGDSDRTVQVVVAETSHVTFEITCPTVGAERMIIFVAGTLSSITEYGTRSRTLATAGQNYFASISPDGTRIAFQTNRDGNNEIYVMDADGSNQRNVSNSPETQDWWPRWSPDGNQLVFYSWNESNAATSEIYVMSASGDGEWQRLTFNDALDADPEWSPEGGRIVFMSERDRNQEIYVMNADGSHQERLTSSPGPDGNATWSPDGTRLAFATSRFGSPASYDIAIMKNDGSDVIQLTSDPEVDIRPIWSPNAERILYSHRVGQGNYDVWVMRADGTAKKIVISTAENEQADDWATLIE